MGVDGAPGNQLDQLISKQKALAEKAGVLEKAQKDNPVTDEERELVCYAIDHLLATNPANLV